MFMSKSKNNGQAQKIQEQGNSS